MMVPCLKVMFMTPGPIEPVMDIKESLGIIFLTGPLSLQAIFWKYTYALMKTG